MPKYMQLKINNSKGHSVNRGKWKDPGAKLYDQLLQAFYCVGGIPTDGKGMDTAIAEGKYKQWPDFLQEAYLVAPVKDIKNSPYGVTPYSRSGCKYPHHTIKNGELVVSIPGLKAAYDRAFRYDDLNGSILRHLNRHMKELGLTHQWHHGQLYWNEQADSMEKIENNFDSIMGYLSESNDELKSAFIMEDEEIYNQQAEGLNSEDYIRPLNKHDVTGSHFINWFFKMDEFADDSPEDFDYDILVHDDTIQNYCYGYFIAKKVEGIIRVRFNQDNNSYGVSMLFVNADNQHIGIGKSLMKHVVSIFGDHDMILRVFSFNTKAISLYKKYGFVKFQEDIYKDGPDSDPKFVGKTMYLMKRNAIHLVNDSNQITESVDNTILIQDELQWIESFVQECQTEDNGHIISTGDLNKYGISEKELENVKKRSTEVEMVESINGPTINNVSTPKELLQWMDCIQYGWISSKDHTIQGTGDNDDEQEFYKYYRLQHPRDLIKSKIGVCWDQAELERYWFDNHNIKNSVLYIELENGEECPTHTFLIFHEDDKFKWFEHSWGQYKGIHSYDTMIQLIQDVSDKHRKSWNDFKNPMKMTLLDPAPGYNISCEEFMSYARSRKSARIPSSDELKSIRNSDPKDLYDPPLSYDQLPEHLKNDPIHSWRAKSGIELIHKEPTLEELDRIWKNWQLMSNEQKQISDEKSMELFGINNEDNYNTLRKNYDKGVTESMHDDLDWIESYLMEEGEAPPPMPGDTDDTNKEVPKEVPEKKPESLPKKTDAAESSKNGVRRKNLYVEFIKWCKEYNPKNMFGSVFDKDAFHTTYPFVPEDLRYFYRLSNPMLCVLAGNLTFFAVAELRKVNAKNSHLNEMMIFAATDTDFRVFNAKDKKVYRGTDENGALTLHEVLGDTFDLYIQKMINKGDILNAPLEEPQV